MFKTIIMKPILLLILGFTYQAQKYTIDNVKTAYNYEAGVFDIPQRNGNSQNAKIIDPCTEWKTSNTVKPGFAGHQQSIDTLIKPHSGHNTNFSWTVGAGNIQSHLNIADETPLIIKDGSDLYVIVAASSQLGVTTWKRFKGTTMDNIVAQSDCIRDSSFIKPFGDDCYWIVGQGWINGNGKWFATAHVESGYNSVSWVNRRICLVSSIDKGLTWHNEGDILTGDGLAPFGKVERGLGDQTMYIDSVNGYAYIAAVHYLMDNDGAPVSMKGRVSNRVMVRCALSDNLAPGFWKKYNDGVWNEKGKGGKDHYVFSAVTGTVFYSTYLKKYVTVYCTTALRKYLIRTCTSLSLQDWTAADNFFDYDSQWYFCAVNPHNWGSQNMDETWRFYEASNNTVASFYRYITFKSVMKTTLPKRKR